IVVIEWRGATPYCRIQIAGDSEYGVTQRFNIQTAPDVGSPEKPVVGILRNIQRSLVRTQGVSGGEHHLPVQSLDGPATLHETRCQVIEQLGMTGAVSKLSEVAGRADDSLPEMMLPEPVDHYPRG